MKTLIKLLTAMMLGSSCTPLPCEGLHELNQDSKQMNGMIFDEQQWKHSRKNSGLGVKEMVGDLVHHHLFGENRDQILQQLGQPDKQEAEFIYGYALDPRKCGLKPCVALEIRFNDRTVQSYRIALYESQSADSVDQNWVNTVRELQTHSTVRVDGEPFDTATWKASLAAGHADTQMLSDLLSYEIPVDTERAKVVALLGKPSISLADKEQISDSYIVWSGKCGNAGYCSFDLNYNGERLRNFRIARHTPRTAIGSTGNWTYQ